MQLNRRFLVFSVFISLIQGSWALAQNNPVEYEQLDFISEIPPQVEFRELPDQVSLEIKIDSDLISLPKGYIAAEAISYFKSLSSKEQSVFLNNRKNILELFSKVIYYPTIGVGFGVVTKDKIVKYFKSLSNIGEEAPPSWREASDNTRRLFLQNVESVLWNNIKLVQDSNEFGLHLNVGLIGLMGAFSKGRGGAFGLFMNFSYNKEQKALAFEFGFDSERYSRSTPGVMNFAVFWKAFPFLSHVNENNFEGRSQGKTYYPPGIFGSTSIDNKFFAFGYTDSPIGFPSFFATLMAYENTVKRTTLLRFSISRSRVLLNSVFTEVVSERLMQLKDFFIGKKNQSLAACHGHF